MANVSLYLGSLLGNTQDADVTIAACSSMPDGGLQERMFHSMILKQVPYFASAFDGGFREAESKRVRVDDVPARLLFPLIETLYTNEFGPLDGRAEEDLVQSLVLCRRFGFPEWVSELVVQRLTEIAVWGKNVLKITTAAFELDLPAVVQVCKTKVKATLAEGKAEFDQNAIDGTVTPSLGLAQARLAIADTMFQLLNPEVPELKFAEETCLIDGRCTTVYAAHEVRDTFTKVFDNVEDYRGLSSFLLAQNHQMLTLMTVLAERKQGGASYLSAVAE
eukprot:TRINITY_DN29529_c0_g1_i1.p1 TRINITY_DN29529_c0_g1~~TRINITY_DN29529_c0_g1_i1.p1  ORF type:complete len:277 (-),score=47.18 TRINITY_DN29529_c0_g1_i1:483-1313(-)